MKISLKLFSLFTGFVVAFALSGCGTATEEVAPPEEGVMVGESEIIETEPATTDSTVAPAPTETAPAVEAPAEAPTTEAAPPVEAPAEEPKP